MVGHLGTLPLAGLALASTLLSTLVGLSVFLAYATTAATGTLVGAGDRRAAASRGVEGIWLAAGIGCILGAILLLFATPVLELFNAEPSTTAQAARYLRASAIGLPGMLVVLAATGTLRGFGDTKRPLYAATAGAVANIPLNFALIYPAGLGVAGAGLGTALSETGMGGWLAFVVARIARGSGASLAPSRRGILGALGQSWPLIVRTVCLRASILAEIAAATSLGTVALAANQIAMTVWQFAAYGLDSLAMAAQILISTAIGASSAAKDVDSPAQGRSDGPTEPHGSEGQTEPIGDVPAVLSRCLRYGVATGIGLGVALAAASVPIPAAMGAESAVRSLSTGTLIVIACCLPLASVAYILDGVLIGAQDTRRLAWYMLAALFVFAPIAWMIMAVHSAYPDVPGAWLFFALWAAYGGVFMAARAGTMLARARSGKPFGTP